MDIFEKLSTTVKQKSQIAAVKAREMAGVAQLKVQISTQEDIIKKQYAEIGKQYFELYGDMGEAPFAKACENIKAAQKQIEDLQEQIKLLKE